MKKQLWFGMFLIAGVAFAQKALAEDGAIWVPLNNTKVAQSINVTNLTDTSAEISWNGNTALSTTVIYGTEEDNLISNASTSCSTTSSNHCTQLTNLHADTTYFFKVPTFTELNNITYEIGGSFKTPSDKVIENTTKSNIHFDTNVHTNSAVEATTSITQTTVKEGRVTRVWNFILSKALSWFK